MPYYRLYFISSRTAHIHRFVDFEAPDDAAACSLAEEQRCEMAMELWNQRRRVRRFEAAPAARPAVA